jgi:hypothetical protein
VTRCLPAYFRTETYPVSETLCSLKYRTMDKSKNRITPSVIRHRQNPLESIFMVTEVVKIFPAFMEPKGSFPCSQKLVNNRT